MSWKNNFKAGQEIVLATAAKNSTPNANIVISMGFVGSKLLVADCQMKNTINNLLVNKKICVIGGYYRIRGEVKIFSSGKYFEQCVQKSKGYAVKHAILITIKEVFDLDKLKLIK